ncbi:tetratricopeptide repeat protein [Flexithrix dorotheae]|uniref:tetratricopeptide repeat protein n=1 Tax=Flexithrix dorotheae TaxID=70993 RepID=UPI00037AE2C3|nr:tetratricopeptide repeat protein [Flexithrix dorotheae]
MKRNMKDREYLISLIEKSQTDDLNAEELIDFNRMKGKDAEFDSLLRQEEEIIAGIQFYHRNEILKQLADLEKTLPPIMMDEEKPGNREIKWKSYQMGIAAGIALVIASSIFFYNYQFSEDPALVFQESYQIYKNLEYPTTRGEEEQTEDLKLVAFKSYEEGKHELAISLFETILQNEENLNINFYMANSHLESGELDKAIQNYKKVIQSNGDYAIQSQWFLALTYLKDNQIAEAKKTLKEIIAADNSYSPKAERVLRRI